MSAVSPMSAVFFQGQGNRHRIGLKGAGAAAWLAAQGIFVPAAANTWVAAAEPISAGQICDADGLLVARLGASEFFVEEGAAGQTAQRISRALDARPRDVYPVLREDWAFRLGGADVHEVLAEVCNVDFAALSLDSNPLIMTLMIGVAVLVVPQSAAGGRHYRIWCDPSFGPYLSEALGAVVVECGGMSTGATA
jgi:sarcosine oxidase subunit gamma